MKRIVLILFLLTFYVSGAIARGNTASEAKKKAKELTKAGWILYDPSGPAIDKQILAGWEYAAIPSKHDKSRRAYIMDTQIGKDKRLENALIKARNACNSNLASQLQAEIGSFFSEQISINSSNDDKEQTKQEVLNIIGEKTRKCLQDTEDGLIIYRKLKDVYEVQITLRLNTDMLYEQEDE